MPSYYKGTQGDFLCGSKNVAGIQNCNKIPKLIDSSGEECSLSIEQLDTILNIFIKYNHTQSNETNFNNSNSVCPSMKSEPSKLLFTLNILITNETSNSAFKTTPELTCNQDWDNAVIAETKLNRLLKDSTMQSEFSGLLPSNFINSLNNAEKNEIFQCVNWNQYYSKCKQSQDNPYLGSISFDHFGYALITDFQVLILSFISVTYNSNT